jgi:hypothetical protein
MRRALRFVENRKLIGVLTCSLSLSIVGCGGVDPAAQPPSTQSAETTHATATGTIATAAAVESDAIAQSNSGVPQPSTIAGATAVTSPTGRFYCFNRICRWVGDGHVQSETAATVQTFSSSSVITVAFNDDYTGGDNIIYTSTTRHIEHGASLMGWAYSTNQGQSWTRGHILTPPTGIAALWGDPAITSSRANQNYVFLSNLMIPDSKFPFSTGYIDGPVNAYIGGACIARSSDAGQSFSVSASDCVSNNNAFYDGGSMTSDNSGNVYAAWNNVNTNAIDVWVASSPTAPFRMIASPFPGISIATHPRMHYDVFTDSVFVMAQDGNGNLWLNKLTNHAWASPVYVASGTAVYPSIGLSDRQLRTGPQFAFDVGNTGPSTPSVVQFCVTVPKGNGHFGIECGTVSNDLRTEWMPAGWSTRSLAGDQFNPAVAMEPYVFGLPAVWKASWTSNENNAAGNTVQIMQTTLTGSQFFTGVLAGAQTPCPDARGNWTDYDDMKVAYVDGNGNPWFIRFFADSSDGACTEWSYYSTPVHVSARVFQ